MQIEALNLEIMEARRLIERNTVILQQDSQYLALQKENERLKESIMAKETAHAAEIAALNSELARLTEEIANGN